MIRRLFLILLTLTLTLGPSLFAAQPNILHILVGDVGGKALSGNRPLGLSAFQTTDSK